MARPDLGDTEELAEYRRELRAYLRSWRLLGLAFVIPTGLWLALKDPSSDVAWMGLGIGGAICVAIIILRTRYHLRRMREPA